MAHACKNELILQATTAEQLDAVLAAIAGEHQPLSFQRLITPRRSGDRARERAWGTVADVDVPDEAHLAPTQGGDPRGDPAVQLARREGEGVASITFETLWSPPRPVIREIARCFPSVTVRFQAVMPTLGLYYCAERLDTGELHFYDPESRQDYIALAQDLGLTPLVTVSRERKAA